MKRENGQIIANGNFLGVWNGSGKNIAPQGASSVRVDAKTGTVLRVQ